jgi:cell shape-determining protein MreC
MPSQDEANIKHLNENIFKHTRSLTNQIKSLTDRANLLVHQNRVLKAQVTELQNKLKRLSS